MSRAGQEAPDQSCLLEPCDQTLHTLSRLAGRAGGGQEPHGGSARHLLVHHLHFLLRTSPMETRGVRPGRCQHHLASSSWWEARWREERGLSQKCGSLTLSPWRERCLNALCGVGRWWCWWWWLLEVSLLYFLNEMRNRAFSRACGRGSRGEGGESSSRRASQAVTLC